METILAIFAGILILFMHVAYYAGIAVAIVYFSYVIFVCLRDKYKTSKTRFLKNTALTIGIIGILIYAYNLHEQQNPKTAEKESDYKYYTSSYSPQTTYENSSEDNESDELEEQDSSDSTDLIDQPMFLSKEEEEELSNIYQEYVVTEIVSGDTIRVTNGHEEKDVKLIGVKAPDINSKDPEEKENAKDLKKALEEKIANKTVYLEKDKVDADSKGRLFRYVWLVRPNYYDPPVYYVETKLLNSQLLDYELVDIYLGEKNTKYNEIFETIVYRPNEMIRNEVEKYENNPEDTEYSSEERVVNTSINQSYVADTTQGVIKGNRRSKIYHMPGQKDYDNISVKNVVYFETEEDAINAGYRKALR